jgi:hypothetical protein
MLIPVPDLLLIPDPDPTKPRGTKLTFFMQELVIIEVIFQTKFNFSSFSLFLMGKILNSVDKN